MAARMGHTHTHTHSGSGVLKGEGASVRWACYVNICFHLVLPTVQIEVAAVQTFFD